MIPFDPNYQFSDRLKGNWRTADDSFEIRITYLHLTLAAGPDLKLDTDFNCTTPQDTRMIRQFVQQFLPGEECRILPRGNDICDSRGTALCRLLCLWYGKYTLHAVISDLRDGSEQELTLKKEGAPEEEPEEPVFSIDPVTGEWSCTCGEQKNKGYFCSNCGKKKPEL